MLSAVEPACNASTARPDVIALGRIFSDMPNGATLLAAEHEACSQYHKRIARLPKED
jgi:hypothetical protein